MKINTRIILIALFIGASFNAKAQKAEELKLKTSAVCAMCKMKLESGLSEQKGVKLASLDLESNILTVRYNPKKTSPEKIKTKVISIGYDANDLKADAGAYKALPGCCQLPEE